MGFEGFRNFRYGLIAASPKMGRRAAAVAFLAPMMAFPPRTANGFALAPAVTARFRLTGIRMHASASPVLGAVADVKSGAVTAEELVITALEQIAASDDDVGAFLSVQGAAAVAAARAVDAKVRARDAEALRQPLLGLPVAIKDNLCTRGVATTAASRILEGYLPSYDATAVARLREAGAIVIGKTNMDEFAMGSTTETSAFRVTRNPRDSERTPGGSSGGSAAAVAAGHVLAALGTDTGGSVRQPAAWCGVVGLKPTYGRVSRSGLVAYASSTDCVGPIAATVADAAAMLTAIAGADAARDSTALAAPVPDYAKALLQPSSGGGAASAAAAAGSSRPLAGRRVGLIKEAFGDNVEPEVAAAVRRAVDVFADLGAEVVEVSLPLLQQQCAAYYVNVFSEASANLARFDGIRYGHRDAAAATSRDVMTRSRREGFGPEVLSRIVLGTFSLSSGYSDAYYKRAQSIRARLRCDFALAFEKADLFLCPTAPTTAYRLGDFERKGVASYADDLFTVPASLAGLPALSLPCGVGAGGLPVGLQIIGAALQEPAVLQAGYAFERATEWHERWRPGVTAAAAATAAAGAGEAGAAGRGAGGRMGAAGVPEQFASATQ